MLPIRTYMCLEFRKKYFEKIGMLFSFFGEYNLLFLHHCFMDFFPICLTHYQTTNFRLFQTEWVCRRQFQIWQKWQKVIQTGRKHCGEKEKLLITSNFSFSHSVFIRPVSQRCQKASLCGNGFNRNMVCSNFQFSFMVFVLLFESLTIWVSDVDITVLAWMFFKKKNIEDLP